MISSRKSSTKPIHFGIDMVMFKEKNYSGKNLKNIIFID